MGSAHLRRAVLVAAATVTVSPAQASAQTQPSVDTRTWAPSPDPRANLVLEPSKAPEAWVWNVAAWASYAQAPVILRDGSNSIVEARPLAHSLGLDVVAGIGLGARMAVGLDVPIFVWQDGTTGLPATIASNGTVKTTGLGDVALSAKATLVDNEPQRTASGFGLAAVGSATLPTGDRTSFWGDGTARVGARALAEYAFAGAGALRASVGYTLRTSRQTWPDASIGGVTFGDEIPWSAGVVVRPRALAKGLDAGDRQLWEVAFHGSLPAGPVAPFGLGGSGASSLSPALLALDDRVALDRRADWFLLFGAEMGLDAAVGVPNVPRRRRRSAGPHGHTTATGTGSSTRWTSARTSRRTVTGSRMPTAAPKTTRTTTASSTRRMPAPRCQANQSSPVAPRSPRAPLRLQVSIAHRRTGGHALRLRTACRDGPPRPSSLGMILP